MKRWLRLAAVFLMSSSLSLPAGQAPSAFAGAPDSVLEAMREEMQRSLAQLALPDTPRPYYIEYRVDDVDQYNGESVFGAIRSNTRARTRLARVVVRLGDYQRDSYLGEAAVEQAPLDNDPAALRHQLWSATDRAFKSAAEAWNQKQAIRKRFQAVDEIQDFSREPQTVSIGELKSLQVDEAGWSALLRRASALYRKDPQVQSLQAVLNARVTNRYFLNSEGSVARSGSAAYMFAVEGSTQAPDGMRLARSPGHTVGRPEELPTATQAEAEAAQVVATLGQLRSAPVVEDEFHGPVWFSADAANTLFNRVGGSLGAVKAFNPGDPGRAQGEYGSSYKLRILPEFLSIVDDPTQQRFQGKTLIGSYAVDDEAVKARPVTVVEKGILVSYLVGRQPVRDFPQSNGHGRAAPSRDPAPHYSNLFVRGANGLPPDKLQEKLIEMCRQRGLTYGYYVQTMTPDLSPRLLYRVYLDGKRELVRGAMFDQLDARALRNDLAAVGDDAYLEQRMDPLSSALVTPSLLFEEVAVKRASRSQEKLPDYGPPPLPAR